MRFDILTVFPELFPGMLDIGVVGRGIKAGLLTLKTHNLRDFTNDKHRSTDDTAYGGGPGMIMKPGPIFECLDTLTDPRPFRILLSPQGTKWSQKLAIQLKEKTQRIALVCGRYEGVDERVRLNAIDLDVSIGDYILAGGEIAAWVVIETMARLIPGIVGNAESVRQDSLNEELLKYPEYTRPANYQGLEVPEILLSGNHKKIDEWRKNMAIRKTKLHRPDLFSCKTHLNDDMNPNSFSLDSD